MDSVRVLVSRVRAFLARKRIDRDFEQELEAHFASLVDENIRRGMTSEESQRAARVQLGGVTQLRETNRGLQGLPWIEALTQDVRYALRMLRKNPGFTSVSVLVLGLGISASVAMFAFVDAALIKPLPYPNPGRLVVATESNGERNGTFSRANLSYPDYLDWKRLNKVLSSIDVYTGTGYLLGTAAGAQPIPGSRVSDGFFRTLGVTPILGRDFYPGEDLPGGPRSVILGYAAWQKWFGGRRDVLGQSVLLSGNSFTIIGVLPRDFQFAPQGAAELWTTLHAADSCALMRVCHNLNGIARLKDGISLQAASDSMKAVAAQLEKQYPDSNRDRSAIVAPLSEDIVGTIRPVLLLLLGGAALLLLIACVNVTSVVLARSESRRREIAVRAALGASSSRLVRQFATEGLVLTAAAVVLGLLAAAWAMKLLVGLIPADMMASMPYLQGLGLNSLVIAFTAAIAFGVAALLALAPTLRLPLSQVRNGLGEGGRSSTGNLWRRFGSNLVVVELAVAVVLLVGAGLLGQSFYRLLHVELKFQPDHLATLEIAAPDATYGQDAQQIALERKISSRIASLPGVRSVAVTTRQLPVSFNGNTDWIRFVGKPYDGHHIEVDERDVSGDYFTTLQARLLRGRYFTDAEDESRPNVVIINQALARKYFPNEDPIGHQIGDTQLTPKSLRQIIGVVDDVREGSLDSEISPTEYLPFNQSPDTYMGVMVRTAQAPESILPTLETVFHQIDPDIGLVSESTMSGRINASPTAYLHRSVMWLVGGFAALALLLGVIGLYGVIAYSVSQRTREIGVRMALGAERSSVYRLVLGEAGRLAAIGIVIGLLSSVGAAALIRNLLFGTAAADPLTLIGVAVTLAFAAFAASYIPARRATKVDPMVALRYE